MQKSIFLFLYPIEPYFASCLQSFRLEQNCIEKLKEIIDERYRKRDYDIAYALFSSPFDIGQPNLNSVPEYFPLEGRILVAGVSFEEHSLLKRYPKPDFILDQLPQHSRLIVGGFHQWDCVDKIAERSYQRGVDTFVDEDTTELFFGSVERMGNVPLVREHWSLKGLGIPEDMHDYVREVRKRKPWFVQN